MKKYIWTLTMTAAGVILAVTGNGVMAQARGGTSVSTFTDSRDGKVYKKVTIGKRVWMAENLNYDVPDVATDVCYGNIQDSCAKYGRLYNWETAQKACPAGWRLPSDREWTALENTVGRSTAGIKLKSSDGWKDNGNGTDNYGFLALPSGNGIFANNFNSTGSLGWWWSATEIDAEHAWGRGMHYDYEDVYRGINYKTLLYSVRCVQN